MDKQIYIIRHGETEYNRLGKVQGSSVDTSLNAKGQAQAQAFFDSYRHLPFEVIFTSVLKRTHETVAPFLALGIPWEQFSELNEMSWGWHEGIERTQAMKDEYQLVMDAWNDGNFHAKLEGGESAQDVAERCAIFVEQLRRRPENTILICAHGRLMRCLICVMRNEPLNVMEKYEHHNTGLYKMAWKDDTFQLLLENDVRHLDTLTV